MKRTDENFKKMLDGVFTVQTKREAKEIESVIGTGQITLYVVFGISILLNIVLILDRIGWERVANVVAFKTNTEY